MMWNPWTEVDRLRQELDNLFSRHSGTETPFGEFPLVNIHTAETSAILTAELPGINPDDLEITCKQNTVTIRGERKPEELKDEQHYLRRERGHGQFSRSFTLPFEVDPDGVEAQYKSGMLHIRIPRAEKSMPKKIKVLAE